MASLYQIQTELLDMFGEIEANEGEVTDEVYDKLCIKQEELKSKLESYYKAVKVWSDEADSCKKEKARINNVQNVYKNRVERLKKAMLQAVVNFGDAGKTNYFVELPTVRLFSRNSTSIEVNEERSKILLNAFRDYITELVDNKILYTGDDINLDGFLSVLNANCKAEYGEEFTPFTMHDLTITRIKISDSATIANMLVSYQDLLTVLGDSITATIENVTSKDDYKESFKMAKEAGCDPVSIATQVNNISLGIK